jgi:hypothetical protein
MRDLYDLATQMRTLQKRLGAFGNETSKDVARTILNDLVQVTPVDVGEALSNWQLTLNTPAVSDIPAYVPSPKGRVVAGKWVHKVDPALTAQANITPTLNAANGVLAAKQPGQTIFITNNIPYIEDLDQGGSTQAPAGFVDRAIILGNDAIARAKL